MAAYEALRDAFGSFNRMLIDSQQWDEQHKANMHARQMQKLQIQNGIEQQQFDAEMRTRAAQLAERKEFRMAEQAEFDRMHSNRTYELNKAGTTENIKASKLSRLNAVNKLRAYETIVNNRDEWMAQAEVDIFTDPVKEAEAGLQGIVTQAQAIEKDIKNLSDPWLQPERAKLRVKQNKLRGEARKLMASVTPQARVENLNRRATKAEQMGTQLFHMEDPKTGQAYLDIARRYRQEADEILSPTKGAKGSKVAGYLSENQTRDQVVKAIKLEGLQGEFLNPLSKPKINAVNALVSRRAKQLARETGNVEASREPALNQVLEITTTAEKAYWESFDELDAANEQDIASTYFAVWPEKKGKKNLPSTAGKRQALKQHIVKQFHGNLTEIFGNDYQDKANIPLYTPNADTRRAIYRGQ